MLSLAFFFGAAGRSRPLLIISCRKSLIKNVSSGARTQTEEIAEAESPSKASNIMPPPKPNVSFKALKKLRKKSGFPMFVCRRALVETQGDVDGAVEWITRQAESEGWVKKPKLKLQAGVISAKISRTEAVLLEMNCQSDTLTRNNDFHRLVDAVTEAVLRNAHSTNADRSAVVPDDVSAQPAVVEKLHLDTPRILEIADPSVQKIVARGVAKLGENISPRRCAILRLNPSGVSLISPSPLEPVFRFGNYIHPSGVGGVARPLGRFGAIVAFAKVSDSVNERGFNFADVGRKLAQHVVGMNPSRVGGEETEVEMTGETFAEKRMMEQEYLFDPSLLVKDYLCLHGLVLLDFVRFQTRTSDR